MSFEIRRWLVGVSGVALIGLAAGPMYAQQQMPPMQVGVIEMTRQDVPLVVTLPGRAVAFQDVDIRPRVGGVIEEILYTPGQTVAVGDPLFRIDDASYAASVAQDKATLATAEANLTVAQSAYDRTEALVGRGYTQAELDTAKATLAEAQASLESAKAALDYSQTELGWTTIKSPIEGRVDVSSVSIGDLVTSGQSDALTTVVRHDPIYVDMLEPSSRMLALRQQIAEGTLNLNDHLAAMLTLENGQVYHAEGSLVSPGTTVSTSTGTFTLRFQFDNPDRLILPGMFLRGEITVGTTQAYLVPQRAASRDNSGRLSVMTVGADGTATAITVNDAGTYQNNWIVRDGLSDGTQVIVDGLKNLTAGRTVTPVPVTIADNGLTQDVATAATPKGE